MAHVDVFRTATASAAILVQIRSMLEASFEEFSDDDWEHALGGWHVVVTEDDEPLAHAAVVPRAIEFDGRPLRCGYLESVATSPDRQGQGFGSMAMAEAGEIVRRHFQVGALSTGSHGFYERLGWERWQGPSFVRRDDGRVIRTQDEDDGIMVLRFGTSRDVRLDDPILCESRHGSDW